MKILEHFLNLFFPNPKFKRVDSIHGTYSYIVFEKVQRHVRTSTKLENFLTKVQEELMAVDRFYVFRVDYLWPRVYGYSITSREDMIDWLYNSNLQLPFDFRLQYT